MDKSTALKIRENKYYFSADLARLILIICLILSRYGIPTNISGYVTPVLNFAPGALFMMYGFFVLRDGADLRKNIKHALIVFIVMFVVFFALATAYMWLVYGAPFGYLTKRGIFNFVVLNYWGPSMGDTIWYVQSVLYSLIICWVLRKLKKFDWIFCIVLFVLAFVIGEGAGFINFSLLGYTYIPGNFLTRTLPYMLLGRLLFRARKKLRITKLWVYVLLIVAGIALCFGELFGFSALNKLVYYGHLLGFIPMAVGVMGLTVKKAYTGERFVVKHMGLYKKLFFVFNPVGETMLILLSLLVSTQTQYDIANQIIGLLVLVVAFLLALCWESVEKAMDRKKHPIDEVEAEEAEAAEAGSDAE